MIITKQKPDHNYLLLKSFQHSTSHALLEVGVFVAILVWALSDSELLFSC